MQKQLGANLIQLTQDACLKAFWRKVALRAFLKQHHIADSTLATWHGDESKRVFLQRIFDALLAVKDNKGHAVIYAMARSLAEMTNFPDLEGWEDSNEKRAAASHAMALLNQELGRLSEEEENRKNAEDRRQAARARREQAVASQETLAALSDRLNAMVTKQGTSEGGYEFERWWYELATYFELVCRPPYRAGGRQIDGSVSLDGTDFLVEAKFTGGRTSVPEIDAFMSKIRRKADNTMGIFISMAGFTKEALREASCDRTPMLLMDYSHIYNLVLAGIMPLPEVLRRIKRHASQTGDAYLAVDKFSG